MKKETSSLSDSQSKLDAIHSFFSAFRESDYKRMASIYHEEATFSDPVFTGLKGEEINKMWEMLLSGKEKPEINFGGIIIKDNSCSARWTAEYIFPATGRSVFNTVQSHFLFQGEKVIKQSDSFNLYKWTGMALGPLGWLLGWTPYLRNKVRQNAARALKKFKSQNH